MLETIVSVVTLIGSGYAFYAWVLPRLKARINANALKQTRLPISVRAKQILLSDSDLQKILLYAKRDAYLGTNCMICVWDQEAQNWRKELPTHAAGDQANLAAYISGVSRKVELFQRMIHTLFQKQTLDMLLTWIHSDSSLTSVVKGIMELLTQGNLAERTKFDIWTDTGDKYSFGIDVFPEERDLIVAKAGVKNEYAIQGAGILFASELPEVVILRHVVPRILLMISSSKEPVSEDELARAFLLVSYNVGLG